MILLENVCNESVKTFGGQCGPVVKADSIHAGGWGSILGVGRKKVIGCSLY